MLFPEDFFRWDSVISRNINLGMVFVTLQTPFAGRIQLKTLITFFCTALPIYSHGKQSLFDKLQILGISFNSNFKTINCYFCGFFMKPVGSVVHYSPFSFLFFFIVQYLWPLTCSQQGGRIVFLFVVFVIIVRQCKCDLLL